MSNHIDCYGYVSYQPEMVLIKVNGEEVPKVTFQMLDRTPSYVKKEPMFIEVQYMKDNAANIFPYLQKGKEIFVMGHLDHKSFVTTKNETKEKYYILADSISLCGKKEKEDGCE